MDWLRFLLVVWIVLYHAAQSQTVFLWPVIDPRAHPAALLVINPTLFVMPIFFFIAGYFTLHSLQPKGAWRFVKTKFGRLVIPGAFVLVFLNPIHRYLHHYTRGFDGEVPAMGYFRYWLHFLSSGTWFQHGRNTSFEFSWFHLWFVNLLFVFFVVTACVHKALGKSVERAQGDAAEASSKPRIVSTVLGATAIAWIAVSLLDAVVTRYEFYMLFCWLDFQVPHIATYVVYFVLGIVAFKQDWFRQTLRLGPLWLWGVVSGAAVAVGGIVEIWDVSDAFRDSPLFGALFWLIRSVLLVAVFLIVLTVGQRHFNRRSVLGQHLTANSYRMYLLHVVILVLIQFAFLHWTGLPALVVLAAVGVSGVVGAYLISAITGLLLQRIGLGWMT